ncbi:signal peptidase I, partial [Chloroflexota bacterium]
GTVVIILAVLLVLTFIVVSQLLGWQIQPVYGGGMSPTFEVGTALVIESAEPEAIAVDDIMAYHSPLDGRMTTHRVIEVMEREEGLCFRTRGDNNEDDDPYIVHAEDVTGMVKHQIPWLGYFSYFVRTPLGVGLMMGLPGLIVTTGEINTLLGTLGPRQRIRKGARWSTGMNKKDWKYW